MRPLILIAASAMAASRFCLASTMSLTGLLGEPNAIVEAQIELNQTAPLTMISWGYGGSAGAPGGTNAAGVAVAPEGFDTYISLFKGWGIASTFLASDDDGTCPPQTASPACLDAYLLLPSLAPGQYTVILSAYGNISIAEDRGLGTLGAGFTGGGSFFDQVSGTTRSPQYAVDISSPALVPEPSTFLLLCTGAGAIAFLKRRARGDYEQEMRACSRRVTRGSSNCRVLPAGTGAVSSHGKQSLAGPGYMV